MATLFQLSSAPLDTDAKCERIYQEYPRKAGKAAALTAIRRALRKIEYEELASAVVEYAKACRQTRREQKFIPHPATWFNQERWDDDISEWYVGLDESEAEEAFARLKRFVSKYGRNQTYDNADFRRAKKAARACPGGWQAFCDGKVTLRQYVEAWKATK